MLNPTPELPAALSPAQYVGFSLDMPVVNSVPVLAGRRHIRMTASLIKISFQLHSQEADHEHSLVLGSTDFTS
jgi:hypothetical protein